jgi:hypothetical protein
MIYRLLYARASSNGGRLFFTKMLSWAVLFTVLFFIASANAQSAQQAQDKHPDYTPPDNEMNKFYYNLFGTETEYRQNQQSEQERRAEAKSQTETSRSLAWEMKINDLTSQQNARRTWQQKLVVGIGAAKKRAEGIFFEMPVGIVQTVVGLAMQDDKTWEDSTMMALMLSTILANDGLPALGDSEFYASAWEKYLHHWAVDSDTAAGQFAFDFATVLNLGFADAVRREAVIGAGYVTSLSLPRIQSLIARTQQALASPKVPDRVKDQLRSALEKFKEIEKRMLPGGSNPGAGAASISHAPPAAPSSPATTPAAGTGTTGGTTRERLKGVMNQNNK